MFSALYIEEAIKDSARVRDICARYPGKPVTICSHFGEIFNRSNQNFRLQKQAPALILAEKKGKAVLPTPAGYGFEKAAAYYFSHMMNCLYDCRYCFLQGMYRSAHYVLFVNYEHFADGIREACAQAEQPLVFYSGYDCDSLAMEPVSGFCDYFLPLFRELPEATLELRTKSTQVRKLLEMPAISNCVIAMSFSSEPARARWEHRVPGLDKRLEALAKLQEAGWTVALRFEPVIHEPAALAHYRELFSRVFAALDPAALHSVSLGQFRMPADFHKRITVRYPEEALFAREVTNAGGVLGLAGPGQELLAQLQAELLDIVSPEQLYHCAADS